MLQARTFWYKLGLLGKIYFVIYLQSWKYWYIVGLMNAWIWTGFVCGLSEKCRRLNNIELWLGWLRGRPWLSTMCFNRNYYFTLKGAHDRTKFEHTNCNRGSCIYWKGSEEKGWKCLALSRVRALWKKSLFSRTIFADLPNIYPIKDLILFYCTLMSLEVISGHNKHMSWYL